MKLLIFVIFLLGVMAYAELPSNNIKDTSTRETTEYLDGKIDNINKSFVDNRSTATFSGWVDIGYEYKYGSVNPGTDADATCSAGKKILGGGCTTDTGYIQQSYPVNSGNPPYWHCKSSGSGIVQAYLYCARIK